MPHFVFQEEAPYNQKLAKTGLQSVQILCGRENVLYIPSRSMGDICKFQTTLLDSSQLILSLMFRSSHFSILVFVTSDDEVTKIQKYHIISVYILQGKMGKPKKTERKSRI